MTNNNTKNKGVLYISYDGLTDPLGQSQIIPYLTRLAAIGFHISIISAEKSERFLKSKTEIELILKTSGIEWYPVSYTKSPPVLSTIKDVSSIKKMAAQLHQKKSFSIVHCRSYIAALVGLWMKKKYRVKFLFDMRGFWANERVDGGIWNLKNPVYKTVFNYFKKKEKAFLNTADHVISLTQNGANEILSWPFLKQPVPVTVIPCCADLDFFDPQKISLQQKTALKKELGINENTLVLSYVGSIGTWYLGKEMLLFFQRLLLKYEHAVFVIWTQENPEILLGPARKMNLPVSKIIIRPVSRHQMPLHLSISDLSLFFIKDAYSKKASSPVKQGELMAMGIPMVCNKGVGDVDLIVNDTHCGVVLNSLTEKGMDDAIQNLDKVLQIDKNIIRAGAVKWYSLTAGAKKYLQVYELLLQNEVK